MTPATIIIAAISIMAGSPDKIELNKILGEKEGEIIEQVHQLEGSQLTKIKNTIDILTKYDLNLQVANTMLANNDQSVGVSYSTDPDVTIIA